MSLTKICREEDYTTSEAAKNQFVYLLTKACLWWGAEGLHVLRSFGFPFSKRSSQKCHTDHKQTAFFVRWHRPWSTFCHLQRHQRDVNKQICSVSSMKPGRADQRLKNSDDLNSQQWTYKYLNSQTYFSFKHITFFLFDSMTMNRSSAESWSRATTVNLTSHSWNSW